MDGAPDAQTLFMLVNSQPGECDKVTLPLSSHGEAHRTLKLHSGVNS